MTGARINDVPSLVGQGRHGEKQQAQRDEAANKHATNTRILQCERPMARSTQHMVRASARQTSLTLLTGQIETLG